MTEPGHEAATTYQLAGRDALSQDDCAEFLQLCSDAQSARWRKSIEDFRRDAVWLLECRSSGSRP